MHIPDGFLSHSINAATFVVSVGACAYGVKRVNRHFGEREVPLMGVTAAFIFAAQMINFPVAGGRGTVPPEYLWRAKTDQGSN